MRRSIVARLMTIVFIFTYAQQALAAVAPKPPWIEKSDAYTNRLLAVRFVHAPEEGSAQGLSKFDERISNPTLDDEIAQHHELQAVLAKVATAESKETDRNVREDLAILRKAFDLQFREEDFARQHEVPFMNASKDIFQGLRTLLDDQVSADRRPAAVARLRKYTGMESGFKPYTEVLEQRELGQIARAGVIYPSKDEVETELGRNSNYVDGIADLFKKYKLRGWEPGYATLKVQLADYDAWVRAHILPNARSDFRLPAERYALALEEYGVDLPPAQIASMARTAFGACQAEMESLAAKMVKAGGYAANDYRGVIAELKKRQITGAEILPFFQKRLEAIEQIILANSPVTLPDRPAILRLAPA